MLIKIIKIKEFKEKKLFYLVVKKNVLKKNLKVIKCFKFYFKIF